MRDRVEVDRACSLPVRVGKQGEQGGVVPAGASLFYHCAGA